MCFVRVIAKAPAHACRLLLHGLGCFRGAGAAGAEMEGVKRVINAVGWVARQEKQRRRVVRQATFAQWPVRGAAPFCTTLRRWLNAAGDANLPLVICASPLLCLYCFGTSCAPAWQAGC